MINPKNVYNIEDILRTYTRSRNKLEQWFTDQVIKLQTSMIKTEHDELKKFLADKKEMITTGLLPYLTYNGRDLYEFFDDEGIIIEIYEIKGHYGYQITNSNNITDKEPFESRWEAEKAAFNVSFEMLEAKFK